MSASGLPEKPSSPTTHELKVWPMYFDDLLAMRKTFEYRKDDREPRFAVGDVLRLREWDNDLVGHMTAERGHTGRECFRRVTYVARDGAIIPAGFCILAIEPLPTPAPTPNSASPSSALGYQPDDFSNQPPLNIAGRAETPTPATPPDTARTE